MMLNRTPAAQWRRLVRTHLTVLCAVGTALVSACGGGSDSASPPAGPVAPPPAAPPPAAPAQLDKAALRLYESAAVHASLAASPLYYAVFDDDSMWASGPCVFGSGSMQGSLDGLPAARGTVLPTGSHTYVVTFANCLVDGLVGTSLNGIASAAYTSTDLNDLTALVSVNSMRGTLVPVRSDLYDVTADGSGTWTRVRTGAPTSASTASTTTYTPAIGSKLVNNSTTNVATFGGGSYSRGYGPPPPGSSGSVQQEFNNLAIAISGTSYTLNGSLHSVYGFGGDASHTGEVRITSNGNLTARIYGDVNRALRTEVLSPLIPF